MGSDPIFDPIFLRFISDKKHPSASAPVTVGALPKRGYISELAAQADGCMNRFQSELAAQADNKGAPLPLITNFSAQQDIVGDIAGITLPDPPGFVIENQPCVGPQQQ